MPNNDPTEEALNELDRSLSEALPCEVDGHEESLSHEGDGVWYVTMTCPTEDCPHSRISLVCDGFLRNVLIPNMDFDVTCPDCDSTVSYEEVIRFVKRP